MQILHLYFTLSIVSLWIFVFLLVSSVILFFSSTTVSLFNFPPRTPWFRFSEVDLGRATFASHFTTLRSFDVGSGQINADFLTKSCGETEMETFSFISMHRFWKTKKQQIVSKKLKLLYSAQQSNTNTVNFTTYCCAMASLPWGKWDS